MRDSEDEDVVYEEEDSDLEAASKEHNLKDTKKS